jgi:integrase
LREARLIHRRKQRHPDGEKDPWGRDPDERTVLLMTTWRYAGTGHATTAESPRHTVGSLLKDLKVPVRDGQTILGHTRISTTLEIYTLTDEPARRDALTRLHGLLDQGQG